MQQRLLAAHPKWRHAANITPPEPQHFHDSQQRHATTNMIANLKLDPKTVASITGHRTIAQNYSTTNTNRQKSALSALQTSLVLPGAPKT